MEDELLTAIEEPDLEQPADGQPDGGEGQQQQGTEGDKASDETPLTSLLQPDGKKLDPRVSSTLSKLKTENPGLGKLLTKAVYRVAELDREFPGGLSEVRELRDKVEELGGVDTITEKFEGLAELDGLAKQFMDADPAFVDDMAQSSPESFVALAPTVFAKYAELNPDGFKSYIGRIVYSDLQRAEVPLMIMRLADVVAENPKAVEILGQLNDYLGQFRELANKAPAQPKVRQQQTAPKDDDIRKREEALRSKEWKGERDTLQMDRFKSEYTKSLAGRKPDAEERADIKERFTIRVKQLTDRLFPDWQKKTQAYIANDDKAGYLRYVKSVFDRCIPEAMAAAVNAAMRGKKAPSGQPPGQTPRQPERNGGGNGQAPAGFVPIGKEPGTWDVDYSRTSAGMLAKNQAILRDGRKVSWRE